MNKKNIKYIVGVLVLVVIVVLVFVMCGTKEKDDAGKKEDTGVQGGLQVEESGEGDSIDFEDFESEVDDKTDTDNDGVVDKNDEDDDNDGTSDVDDEDDNNDGTPDVEDPKHPSYEGSGDDNTGDDNTGDDNTGDDNTGDDKEDNSNTDPETGWSPFF